MIIIEIRKGQTESMRVNIFKRAVVLVLAVLMLLQCTGFAYYEAGYYVGKPNMTNWYAWEPQDDKAALGTAIDASIWLDAPAGKHGYIKPDGHNLRFEDGTQIKFWGTNVCSNALFFDKEKQEFIADRIARSGYNLVRFHQTDRGNKDNILGSDYQLDKLIADPAQLDKLHYFLYLLKERGVYVTMDLTYGPPYKANGDDTFKNDPKGSTYANMTMARWSDDGMKVCAEYFRSFLEPVNPYTGLSMAEDPAIVYVNLFNEESINLQQLKDTSQMADVEKKWYQKRFNDWLMKKYGSTEELKKAWTQEGATKKLAEYEKLEYGTVAFRGNTSYAGFLALNPSEQERADIRQFLYDNQVYVYKFYIDFLRNEVGYKNLISAVGGGGGSTDRAGGNMSTMGMQQSADLFDVYDVHVYKSHPIGGGRWDDPYTLLSGWTASTSQNAWELYKGVVNNHVYQMPQFISEWNVCSPGPYAAEGQIFMAVNAATHNWNPIHFCMIGEEMLEPGEEMLNSYFGIIHGADQMAMLPAAAALFHRGEIKELEEQYYMPWTNEEAMAEKNNGKLPIGFEHLTAYYNAGTVLVDTEMGKGYEPDTESMERAVQNHIRNTPQSDQMFWNDDMIVYKVETEYANVVTGYIGQKKIEFDYSTIEYENYSGVATLTSTTEDTLRESDSVLVTLMSKARNTDEEFDKERGAYHLRPGRPPLLVEPIVAGITIKTTDDIKVYALSHSGARKEEVALEKLANGYWYFKADGVVYKTPYYEIVKGEK